MNAIAEFDGEYRWLSNFYPVLVVLDGVVYPSVENAYQAAKTQGERSAFETCKPGKAKRLGRKVVMRSDWDAIKVSVMQDLLQQKFNPGSALANKLLATGEREIIEGNTWGDVFWGVCEGRGKNHLGKLLMQIRDRLRDPQVELFDEERSHG